MHRNPDLAIIYNKSASYHYPDRNPIIAIPGIMGSKLLYSPTDTVAWGAFEGGAADSSDADGARIIALPIGPGRVNSVRWLMMSDLVEYWNSCV